MNITSILRLATTFVALSFYSHAVEIFSVQTNTGQYPVTTAANFTGGQYDIYGTTDTGNGNGWGGAITTNFDGSNSVVNPGDQSTGGVNTSTYFGPTFYAGINRDYHKGSGGVHNSNNNGYRIRVNNIAAADIEANNGNDINIKAVFMFDADTSLLSSASNITGQFQFLEGDQISAIVAMPNNAGDRTSLATYRPVVKADGEYYVGPLYTVDLSTLSGSNSSTFTVDTDAGTANWILMPNMESSNNSVQTNPSHPQNLTVDTSESATTAVGSTLTNITQVGFLLETIGVESSAGGYTLGVRGFSAQATIVTATGKPVDPIEWSQDFTTEVPISDGLGGLSGEAHAFTWSKSGSGLTADPASSVVQDTNEDQIVLEVNNAGSAGAVYLKMIGPGTDNGRRVAPVFHETTFEIDFISFKGGQADLTLRTRGLDGYVQSTISQTGVIKYSTWMSNYTHTNFDNFSGPSKLRTPNNSGQNNGIIIVDGGTFDPASADPVTVTISGNAEGTVVMNAEGTAVESVTLTNYGSGYTADPTVTFAGGGMTVAPTVSFNYETGNISNSNVVQVALGDTDGDGNTDNWNVFQNGMTLTYIQSYNSAEDSISYYYALDGAEPTFITTLTAADHSAGGYGFFNFSTGNYWVQPRNQDAVYIQYQKWNNAGPDAARVGINSISVATSDDDGDNVINRNDAFPDDATESADDDGDGVGNNTDAHPGYDDAVFTPYINDWLADNNYILDDGTSGGISQEDYDAVVAERDARPTQAAYDAVVAEIDAIPTAAEVRSSFLDDRDGSVGVSVSGGEATISLQVEQSTDITDPSAWTAPSGGAADVVIPVSGDATFLRVRAQ